MDPNTIGKAREQHKLLALPGDLAADVLSPGTQGRVLNTVRHRRISRGLSIGSAIAAMAAAIVLLWSGGTCQPTVSPNQYAGPITYDDDANVSLGSVPVVSTVDPMPTDMQLMPEAAADMSVSMPRFSLSCGPGPAATPATAAVE